MYYVDIDMGPHNYIMSFLMPFPYLVIHNITFREFFYKKLHEEKKYHVA